MFVRQRSSGGTAGTLCAHPARKFVLDFLKVIILESFALPMSARGVPVIDIVLEVRTSFVSNNSCSGEKEHVRSLHLTL